MPIYEFECKCGNIVEELVPSGTDSFTCPQCKEAMKKLVSMSSFHLKGSGWYTTDYGSKSDKASKNKKQG